jgi:hypothetical protein
MASNGCEPLLEHCSSDTPGTLPLQFNSVTVPVPAANQGAARAADNYQIKQVKAVATGIRK